MTRTTLRAWLSSVVALVVTSAGLFAVSAASTTTSLPRMAVAAGVLSALAAAAALIVTEPAQRVVWRRLLWAGAVPLGCALGTAFLVGAAAGPGPAVWSAVPWVIGAAAVCVVGGRLPDLQGLSPRSLMRRLRERTRG